MLAAQQIDDGKSGGHASAFLTMCDAVGGDGHDARANAGRGLEVESRGPSVREGRTDRDHLARHGSGRVGQIHPHRAQGAVVVAGVAENDDAVVVGQDAGGQEVDVERCERRILGGVHAAYVQRAAGMAAPPVGESDGLVVPRDEVDDVASQRKPCRDHRCLAVGGVDALQDAVAYGEDAALVERGAAHRTILLHDAVGAQPGVIERDDLESVDVSVAVDGVAVRRVLSGPGAAALRAGFAGVAHPVSVGVRLIGLGYEAAVVLVVGDAVAVGVASGRRTKRHQHHSLIAQHAQRLIVPCGVGVGAPVADANARDLPGRGRVGDVVEIKLVIGQMRSSTLTILN